jgi:hypothetical protein
MLYRFISPLPVPHIDLHLSQFGMILPRSRPSVGRTESLASAGSGSGWSKRGRPTTRADWESGGARTGRLQVERGVVVLGSGAAAGGFRSNSAGDIRRRLGSRALGEPGPAPAPGEITTRGMAAPLCATTILLPSCARPKPTRRTSAHRVPCFTHALDSESQVGGQMQMLVGGPLPPLAYRLGVNPVMAVRIEPQPAPEARVARELFLRHGLQVVDEPDVDLVELR